MLEGLGVKECQAGQLGKTHQGTFTCHILTPIDFI
jgi:hypothetical protein